MKSNFRAIRKHVKGKTKNERLMIYAVLRLGLIGAARLLFDALRDGVELGDIPLPESKGLKFNYPKKG